MKAFKSAGLAALMAGTVFAPANAQLARKSTAPMAFDFRSGGYDPDTCIYSLLGGGSFTQETSQLRSQVVRRIDARKPDGSCGELLRIEAEGSVFYITPESSLSNETARGTPAPQLRIRADKAVYTAADDLIVFTGEPVTMASERGVSESRRITVHVSTGRASMDSGEEGRVQGVFRPPPKKTP
jgi:lipopolysaccharide export system protein LptA